jgi:Tol biopolymer transport system component
LTGTDAPDPNHTDNIWRVNSDGTGLSLVIAATINAAGGFAPQWSPNGAKVVFYSRRRVDSPELPSVNGTYNIWRANADGTGLTPLTNATASAAHSYLPTFSP